MDEQEITRNTELIDSRNACEFLHVQAIRDFPLDRLIRLFDLIMARLTFSVLIMNQFRYNFALNWKKSKEFKIRFQTNQIFV